MVNTMQDGNQAGDAVAVLRWGLRRYAWLVLGAMIVVGVLLPWRELHKKPVYTSEALVVAVDLKADLKTLPRFGEHVFDNGVVARIIGEQFGVAGDTEDVVPKRASVVTEQDSLVMTVQGHARDPQTAADIANAATTIFVSELNKPGSGVGTFQRQSDAVPPIERDEPLQAAPYSISLGLVAGLIMGVGLLTLLLALRRPVVDSVGAGRATDAPVFGTVTLPKHIASNVLGVEDVQGLTPVCRQLLEWSPTTVVLTGPDSADRQRSQLAHVVAEAFGRIRQVRLTSSSDALLTGVDAEAEAALSADAYMEKLDKEITVIDGSSAVDLLSPGPGAFVLLVVPVGIPVGRLRALASELRGVPSAIVLCRSRRGRRSSSARTALVARAAEEPADPQSKRSAPPSQPAAAGSDPNGSKQAVSPRPSRVRDPEVDAAVEWVAGEAGSWFPDMSGGVASLRLVDVRERPRGRLLHVEMRGKGAPRQLMIKLRRSDPTRRRSDPFASRPALCPPAHGDDRRNSLIEYDGLRLIEAEFGKVDDGRFSVVSPYGCREDLGAIAMEFDPSPTLREVSLLAARGSALNGDYPPALPWRHAGSWLRRFHGLTTEPLPATRRGSADEVLELLGRYGEFLAARTGHRDLLSRFVDKVSSAAQEVLPQNLPMGLGHGDFVARNILVSDSGAIRVIDPMPRWRVPVYEDLGRLLVGSRLFEPQSSRPDYLAERPQPRLAECALLAGYFGDGAIPIATMRIFLALCTLDKWSDTVSKEPTSSLRRRARGSRVVVANRHYRRELHSQMEMLLPSDRHWVDSWV